MDAVELTVLLKAAGFRLESFDFKEKPNAAAGLDSSGVRVEITCPKSGIVSRLTGGGMSPDGFCSCPSASAQNNNSFWEVHGTAPNMPGGVHAAVVSGEVYDSSSNLLPVLSTATLDRTTLLFQALTKEIGDDIEASKTRPTNVPLKE